VKLIATEDSAFDLTMLQQMAKRIGADVPTVSAKHALPLTQPKGVAAVIEKAAKSTSKYASGMLPTHGSSKTSCFRFLLPVASATGESGVRHYARMRLHRQLRIKHDGSRKSFEDGR
jgi:4-diphosphocytidyl-2C-methyl-D-erythritol kinase